MFNRNRKRALRKLQKALNKHKEEAMETKRIYHCTKDFKATMIKKSYHIGQTITEDEYNRLLFREMSNFITHQENLVLKARKEQEERRIQEQQQEEEEKRRRKEREEEDYHFNLRNTLTNTNYDTDSNRYNSPSYDSGGSYDNSSGNDNSSFDYGGGDSGGGGSTGSYD